MALILLGFLALQADGDFSGYFENRFFLLNDTPVSWSNLDEKFSIGDYNRLRLQYSHNLGNKISAYMAVDLFSFHGFISSPLGLSGSTGTNAKHSLDAALDRAYLNIYFKKFDVTLGKQRVALGISYLWAPLDVFNRVNVFEPKEEKPGTNALKVYIPLGDVSSITAVYANDLDFNAAKSAVRAHTQLWGVDGALTFIRASREETTIYGLDLRGENFLGWWLEAGYFDGPAGEDIKLVLGFDYTFPINKGLYWLNEYFYDSGGAHNPVDYSKPRLSPMPSFTLGRHYYFSMLRYSFSDFLSGSMSYIGNLGDGSYILNPSLQYEISQNLVVSGGFYFPMGARDGEFKMGDYNIFFVWLKYNF